MKKLLCRLGARDKMWGNLFPIALCAMLLSVQGCAPRIRVRQSPGPDDTGIRYYRPKPYLRVEPGQVTEVNGKVVTQSTSDEFVTITLEYLPDFSEEYSISVCTGVGRADVSVNLEDGWNLTEVSQDLDSNFDENVKAIADLAGSIEGFVPSAKSSGGAESGDRRFVVAATNVPIGYYESVISRDSCGRKRLFGWRYLGFLPYETCPTDMCGSQHQSCQEFPTRLYGMVFRDGVMTFCRMDSITGTQRHHRTSVTHGTELLPGSDRLGRFDQAVRRAFLDNEGIDSEVVSQFIEGGRTIEVSIRFPDDDLLDAPNRLEPDRVQMILQHVQVETALNELGNPVPRFLRLPPTIMASNPEVRVGNRAAVGGIQIEDR